MSERCAAGSMGEEEEEGAKDAHICAYFRPMVDKSESFYSRIITAGAALLGGSESKIVIGLRLRLRRALWSHPEELLSLGLGRCGRKQAEPHLAARATAARGVTFTCMICDVYASRLDASPPS